MTRFPDPVFNLRQLLAPRLQSQAFRALLLAGAALLGLMPVAPASAQSVTTQSTAINPKIPGGDGVEVPVSSYSVAAVAKTTTTPAVAAMTAYSGFKIVVSNPSTSAEASAISFSATVAPVNGAGRAPFFRAQAPTGRTISCTAGKETTISTVRCTISGTLPKGASLNFALFFNSPVKTGSGIDTNSCKDSACLRLSGTTTYTASRIVRTSTLTTPVEILLGSGPVDPNGPKSPREVKAYTAVPTSGARLATGYDLNTIYGQFFSQVVIPSTTYGYTSASIVETSYGQNSVFGNITCTNFTTCWTSDITVPPPAGSTSFAPGYLTITLRANANDLAGNTLNLISANLNNPSVVPVYYYATPTATPVAITQVCGTSAIVGVPCFASRVIDSGTSLATGDVIWTIRNFNNGGYMFR